MKKTSYKFVATLSATDHPCNKKVESKKMRNENHFPPLLAANFHRLFPTDFAAFTEERSRGE